MFHCTFGPHLSKKKLVSLSKFKFFYLEPKRYFLTHLAFKLGQLQLWHSVIPPDYCCCCVSTYSCWTPILFCLFLPSRSFSVQYFSPSSFFRQVVLIKHCSKTGKLHVFTSNLSTIVM